MLARFFQRSAEVQRSVGYPVDALAGFLKMLPSGSSMSWDKALTHAASWACIDVLASAISTTPIDVVRYVGAARQPVVPAPPLIDSPSVMVEQDVWMYQLASSLLSDGNAFGLVVATDGLARPTQIELLDPDGVTRREVHNGVATVYLNGTDERRLYPYGDIFHVPGKMVKAGSPFAVSPLDKAAETINAALQARRFGMDFFTSGHPTHAITSTEELNPEQAKAIKQAYLASSVNREPFVKGEALNLEALSVSPDDSQFIALMQFVIEETCRFWRVPPAMVYAATSGQNVTYSNTSQADLAFLKWSLDFYLVRIERRLSSLIVRPQVVKFNRNALLRADAPTRFAVYDLRLKNKSMSVNDVHALEDEPPVSDPEYDKPGIPGGPEKVPTTPVAPPAP